VITVWLPDAAAETVMGGMPVGMRADVWTGTESVPATAGSVQVVIPPFPVMQPHLAVLAKLPSLKLIQTLSAGAEKVIPYVPDGVTLACARGAHDASVAEWVVSVILASLHDLPRFVIAQQAGAWDFGLTGELAGKRVLIVGYGSIGAAVEKRLAGFDVTMVRVARHERPGVNSIADLDSLLPSADVVVLLVPVTAATTGMVNAGFLRRMRDGALLVNAARGAIVSTDALVAELHSGRLRAALDVTEPEPLPAGHPLWSAPGLLLTPHVGGASGAPLRRALAVAKDQLVRYASGQPLVNVVGADGY
jgi:phosphoglycerate dehydrogenase-like enzyme